MKTLTPQDLIGEVAKRHQVLLDEKDPILVTLTLNELILEHYIQRINQALQTAQLQTLAGSAAQMDGAQAAAKTLIDTSGAELASTLRQLIQEEVAKADVAVQAAQKARDTSQKAALAAVGGAGILLGFALGALLIH